MRNAPYQRLKLALGCATIVGMLSALPLFAAGDKEPVPPTPAEIARAKKLSANNLKQIALAFHNYNDTLGSLPLPAILSKDQKPLLSWRVAVLPFVEQEELYKQFKLDEPWDSEHNKPLLARMPKLYAPVLGKTKEPNSTYYQVFVGKHAAFETGVKQRIPASFPDGTSNTFFGAEAGDAVPWTTPADLEYDAEKPLPKLGGLYPKSFLVFKVDGAVMEVKKDFDEKNMRLAITRDDGMPIDFDTLKP